LVPSHFAEPWNELMSAHMGGKPHGTDITPADTQLWARLNGVFWAAFLLFSWTTASIVSGSIIERVRSGAFWLIAVMLGSVTWIIDAAWGWHPSGWMVQLLGYHDAYASGVVHAIAGGTTLAVLIKSGAAHRSLPGRRNGAKRSAAERMAGLHRAVPDLHWLLGLLRRLQHPRLRRASRRRHLLVGDQHLSAADDALRHHLQFHPVALRGDHGGLPHSKADPYWTFSGGLAGVIACSAGNDLYHPIQALVIAAVIVVIIYKMHYWVERRFKIDDAVGPSPCMAMRVSSVSSLRDSCSGAIPPHPIPCWAMPSPGHGSRPGVSSPAPSSCSGCSASSRATCCPGS
jgi:Ammonia permease